MPQVIIIFGSPPHEEYGVNLLAIYLTVCLLGWLVGGLADGIEDNTVKKYALMSLGATQVPALQQRTLSWCINGPDVKLQDFFYPIQSVASAR